MLQTPGRARHDDAVRGRVAAALLFVSALLALAACDRAPKPAARRKAATHQVSDQRIIVLPDSAIAVKKGSAEEALADYLASDAPAPRTFRFEGPEFESWASKPNPGTLRTMYSMTQILRAYPKTHVLLAGYTDNDGTAAQNRVLAQQRADGLAAILVQGGIRPRRIETVGKGAVDFIADNATPEGRARNRRIELTVTRK